MAYGDFHLSIKNRGREINDVRYVFRHLTEEEKRTLQSAKEKAEIEKLEKDRFEREKCFKISEFQSQPILNADLKNEKFSKLYFKSASDSNINNKSQNHNESSRQNSTRRKNSFIHVPVQKMNSFRIRLKSIFMPSNKSGQSPDRNKAAKRPSNKTDYRKDFKKEPDNITKNSSRNNSNRKSETKPGNLINKILKTVNNNLKKENQ
jgi:hypothetical protein